MNNRDGNHIALIAMKLILQWSEQCCLAHNVMCFVYITHIFCLNVGIGYPVACDTIDGSFKKLICIQINLNS